MKKPNYYTSLDTLKILMFWKIIETNNIKLLDKDYSEDKKYTKKQLQDLEVLWLRLYDEYFVLTDDKFIINNIKKQMSIGQINADLMALKSYQNTLIILKDAIVRDDKSIQLIYANLLKLFPKIGIQYFESEDYNINKVNRVINALTNKYNQLNNNISKGISNKIKNVYEIVNNAESWIERSIPIDTVVVAHWIAIAKDVKQRKQASDKNKRNGK